MPTGVGIPTNEAIPMLVEALGSWDEDHIEWTPGIYGESDVRRWFDRHARITGKNPRVWGSDIEAVRMCRKVPNEPFRKPWANAAEAMSHNFPGQQGGHIELFREELARVSKLPKGLDSSSRKFGPNQTSASALGDYLNHALGVKAHKGRSGITSAWLLSYEVAEALCKTLGLIPYTVGV